MQEQNRGIREALREELALAPWRLSVDTVSVLGP